MLALIQRVTSASVAIEGKQTAAIEKGLLVLLGIEKADTEADAEKLLKKCWPTGSLLTHRTG